MTDLQTPRCGFIAVIGAPNAGKSTLINQIVGAKVTIVSPKVQTTRMRVRAIVMRGQAQMIFVDTPGIFKPKRRLDRAMVSAAWEGEQEADITALVVDASRRDPVSDAREIVVTLEERLREASRQSILILNKTDRMAREGLLPITAALNETHNFDATFMISALSGRGVDDVADWIAVRLPEGPAAYPEDQLTDMPSRLLAAEITREKLFMRLHEELPYALTVETETWDKFDNGDIRIGQIIMIAREAHRPIILGKGGATIKAIGQSSRHDLEEVFGCKVHLNLFVKVHEKWMDDPECYTHWGLNPDA